MLRQLLYVSTSFPVGTRVSLDPIYEVSRHNNAIDGITGLLVSDGHHFLQVLEGPPASVEAAFVRIALDPRHHDIEVLSDTQVAAREFGGWSMADRRLGERADAYDTRLRRLVERASPVIRDAFLDLLVPA